MIVDQLSRDYRERKIRHRLKSPERPHLENASFPGPRPLNLVLARQDFSYGS